MKTDQFLVDFWKEDDDITVQCLWLQKQLVEKKNLELTQKLSNDTVKKLLFKIEQLEARLEFYEATKRRLDERV